MDFLLESFLSENVNLSKTKFFLYLFIKYFQ